MITVSEAKGLIAKHTTFLPPAMRPVGNSAGHILSNDVFSPVDMPNFPQSSMDGYAFSFSGWKEHQELEIVGESAAGTNNEIVLETNEAVRIFTGAPVPASADTVVMQEKTNVINGVLKIIDHTLKKGDNVRPKGAEIQNGSIALMKNTYLTPAAVGFLSGLGITTIDTFPFPKVTIIVTGNELQQPGVPLAYGQVYESNSFTLKAALKSIGIDDVTTRHAKDDLYQLTEVLNKALTESNIVLLTGGVSVGDYDFVLEAVALCGITTIFHKIKQRPGKPIFFGIKDQQVIFGLPGNPASVLTCFYEYVCLAIQQLTMRAEILKQKMVPIRTDVRKPAGLTHFLKGIYDGSHVQLLDAQESYRLSSFAKANCLVVVPEDTTVYQQEDIVEIHLLPV